MRYYELRVYSGNDFALTIIDPNAKEWRKEHTLTAASFVRWMTLVAGPRPASLHVRLQPGPYEDCSLIVGLWHMEIEKAPARRRQRGNRCALRPQSIEA